MLRLLRSSNPVRLVTGDNAGHGDPTSEPMTSVNTGDGTTTSAAFTGSPSVLEIIKSRVPSLCDESREYKPAFPFTQKDVQTVVGNFASIDSPLCCDRYYMTADDGGTLAVDFPSAPWLEDDAPIVIILPGLSGNSLDMYVGSAVRELSNLRDGSAKGYRIVVMNPRGTPGCPLTSPQLTHAGSTDDLRSVISNVCMRFPEAKGLFALGFSMGGALLSNYLAEEGDSCPIDAGFCISPVLDLAACSERIEKGSFFRRWLYSYSCGTLVARIVRDHEKLFREAGSTGLDELLSHSTVRMSTFNDVFMSHLAGYPNTAAFAAATSPIFRMNKIRRPCVLLNARDDPFYGGKCLEDLEKSVRESGQESLVLATTKRGGHIGWLTRDKKGNLDQWFVHPVREFFDAILLESAAS